MEDNLYKAPEADLASPSKFENDNDLYIVSANKLAVLYFSTLGMYSVYWMYKNWKKYNDIHNLGIMPIARAIFSIFFTHQLFWNIDEKLQDKNIDYLWNPTVLATLYVVINISSQIIDKLPDMGEITLYLTILPFLFLGIEYAILLKAQKAINVSQNDLYGSSNSEYTLANYIWIVLGLSLWFLSISLILFALGIVDIELFNQM